MVNRLVSVDEDNNLPPEVQQQLVGGVETYFESLTTAAQSAASVAQTAADESQTNATLAELANQEAQEAAAQAQAPTQEMVDAATLPLRQVIGVSSGAYLTPGLSTNQATGMAEALTAAAAHDSKTLVLLAGTYIIDTPVTVPEGMTVQGQAGTILRVTGDTSIFTATSKNTYKNITFRGTNPVGGAATLLAQYGINCVGVGGARLTDLLVEDCSFEGFEYAAIRIRFTDRFNVHRNRFFDTGYSSVQIGSAADGLVENNYFRGTGILPSYAVNSYAVSVSLGGGAIDPVTNPQPRNIRINNNTVTNQAWEALDTHGGEDLTFSGNVIIGCEMGIAVTWRTGTAGTGPQRVVVADNVINGAGYPDIAVRAGMSINGAADGSSYATVVVTGNVVANHGVSMNHAAQWDPRSGGIVASWCDSIIVSNNLLSTIRGAGISFKNCTSTNASGNIFRAIWRETGDNSRLSSCVYLDGVASVTLTANQYRFSAEGKPNANERVIYAATGSSNAVTDLGNNWGNRINENVTSLSPGQGGFNEGVDLGGFRLIGTTPLQPSGAVANSTLPSAYPYGESHRNATSSGTNGWPFNGLLITYRYADRTFQVLHEFNGVRMARRNAAVGEGSWVAWRIFTGV